MTHKQRKAIGGRGMSKEAKEQVSRLENDGWEVLGAGANGHIKLAHPSGARIGIARTPSDWRTRRNELAVARRRVNGAST